MKILRERSRTKTAVKWAGYLAVAYLLASWGVNGVVNPMHYMINTFMHIQQLEMIEDDENLILELPQDNGMEKSFLSFRTESQDYSFDMRMYEYSQRGDVQEVVVKVWKGWNCIELEKLQGTDLWTRITMPKHAEGKDGYTLEAVGLSKYRRVETGKMLYMTVSFFLLAMFWECVWWIKERYA